MSLTCRRCWQGNPMALRLLGLCPVLAVSNTLIKAVTIALVLLLVMMLSGLIASAMRFMLTWRLRPLLYVLIVSVVVAVVESAFKIGRYQLAHELGIYVPLLAANCLVLSYVQEFAGSASMHAVARRGTVEGAGILGMLAVIGTIREFLARGSLLTDLELLIKPMADPVSSTPQGPIPIMGDASGALLLLGLILAFGKALSQYSVTADTRHARRPER